MLVRRSTPDDLAVVRSVTAAAFRTAPHRAPSVDGSGDPGEAALVGWLLEDPAAIPALSLVAQHPDGPVVGHVVASRGDLAGHPVLGLGPLSVWPDQQGRGVGSALMHAVLAAADARDEPLVALLGDPAYYGRFGFKPAATLGVVAPDPAWGDYFRVRALTAHRPDLTGRFSYHEAFDRLAG